jgi:hypothetical protein
MSIESLNQEVDQDRGKSGGWPEDLIYRAREETESVQITVTVADAADYSVWKRIDPWGLAFFEQVKAETTTKAFRLRFSVPNPKSQRDKCQYEALKRRLSYLVEVNDWQQQIYLMRAGLEDKLYSWADLGNRPENEVIHDDFSVKSDTDKPGRLEKDFQAYLYGKGLHDAPGDAVRRTNERLALLGPDFVRIQKVKSFKKQKGFTVEREFPTGVFDHEIKGNTRILPTEHVDLVTLNRWGDLAVIEIKFDDNNLEVVAQVLNYALFFHSYRSRLNSVLNLRWGCSIEGRELVTYLVSNEFHPRFESVWHYYSRNARLLRIKQVIMGHMPDAECPNAD